MHRSAISQATGEAVYCDDMPKVDGELFLVLVTSSRAHAKITWVVTERVSSSFQKTFLQPKTCYVWTEVWTWARLCRFPASSTSSRQQTSLVQKPVCCSATKRSCLPRARSTSCAKRVILTPSRAAVKRVCLPVPRRCPALVRCCAPWLLRRGRSPNEERQPWRSATRTCPIPFSLLRSEVKLTRCCHPFGVKGSRCSVLSRQEAIERSSFFGPCRMLERGNVTEAFETVDQVYEGKEQISAWRANLEE